MSNELINPFSSLGKLQQERKWVEIPLDLTEEISETKVIEIPEDQIALLRPQIAPKIYTQLEIRSITRDEINKGKIEIPVDTINLSLLDTSILIQTSQTIHSVISQVIDYYEKLTVLSPSISRDQICYSQNQKLVIILPKYNHE